MEPNPKYANLASEEAVTRTAESLKKNNVAAEVVPDAVAAKARVLELIPEGSEVMTMTSETLRVSGIAAELDESGKYVSVRAKLGQEKDDKVKKGLAYAADFTVGSVHAVTENGSILIASNTGSQLGAYANGAGKVIWVVSTAKIVTDLDQAFRRIYEYSLPLESERAHQAYGVPGSAVNKILIVNREGTPDRTHLIFVKEKLGF